MFGLPGGSETILGAAAVALVAYPVPAVVAFARGHHQRVAILVLNLLLGWTGLGWIAALVWSATATPPRGSG